MKTAISLEGDLLNQADRAARKMGVSRSRLFSLALQAYLRAQQQERMVEQLDRVYTVDPDTADSRTAKAMKAKFRSTLKDRW
jgi:metal-responsive CopG/Arc/MetJ family transcriptional regulator